MLIILLLHYLVVVVTSVEEGTLKEGLLLESVTSTKVSEEMARVLFTGLRFIVTTAVRQPNLKPEVWLSLDE